MLPFCLSSGPYTFVFLFTCLPSCLSHLFESITDVLSVCLSANIVVFFVFLFFFVCFFFCFVFFSNLYFSACVYYYMDVSMFATLSVYLSEVSTKSKN